MEFIIEIWGKLGGVGGIYRGVGKRCGDFLGIIKEGWWNLGN